MKKLIFQVNVEINNEDGSRLKGPGGEINVIPFGGTVEGELFNGVVRPGAADIQTVNLAGVRHMDAKYFMTGKDYTGADCSVYVENEGWFTPDSRPTVRYFTTVPRFWTDSEALAPLLHSRRFIGEGHPKMGGVTIMFFDIGEEEEQK